MYRVACAVLTIIGLNACGGEPASTSVGSGPVRVEVAARDGRYVLLRDGQPYFVRGAGLEFGDMASLAAHGANSFRTWTTANGVESAASILDRAWALGLTVALCLPMQAERWGFDYDDDAAVAAQLADFREQVRAYRDHPALLAWIIGNELNFDYGNPRVYDAVNDVSRMIHELDPSHPTTTAVAGLREDVIREIETRAPDLDFLSFQVYGELFAIPGFLDRTGYDKPFLITEWGAIGHWETGRTTWGAPIEPTSSEKAAVYVKGYREIIEPNLGQVIGNYAFLWGQKQERTSTWFGMFTEKGEATEVADVMQFIWTGAWPQNRAPRVDALQLDGRSAQDSVVVAPGARVRATVRAFDTDSLTYRWEVKPESDATQVGGDFEEAIRNLDGLVTPPDASAVMLTAPPAPGAYRLFVYAYDGNGHAGHANVPFFVGRE